MAPRRRRGTRTGLVRVALACGLVFGVAASVTLATWTDREHATGTFTAGTLDMQGSTDGEAWSSHATTATSALLGFGDEADELSPGMSVTAPFALRLAPGTSTDATVTLASATVTGDLTDMHYSILRMNSFTCDTGTPGNVAGTLVPADTSFGSAPAGATFTLQEGANRQDAGSPVYLCILAGVRAGAPQGQSGTAQWTFTAESR